MMPPVGASRAEVWVAEGRRAAARDLVLRLSQLKAVDALFVLAADPLDAKALLEVGVKELSIPPGEFHFGRALAHLIAENGFQRLAYFGGGSAPLMTETHLADAFEWADRSDRPQVVVNNYHSTDWMILNQAHDLISLQERLPKDNPLGWVLDHEGGIEVHAVSPCAASRVDIDTPTDLLMLDQHPSLGDELRQFMQHAPAENLEVVRKLRQIMQTPASTLALIGRTSPRIWQAINERTQIWIRTITEERGMIASGRLRRGEVNSIVGHMLEEWGPGGFIERITQSCDGLLWDTRVWMAHRGPWPSTADRFASDLGWVDDVTDHALRDLTRAVRQADVPILVGGHGVVTGGVYALLDTLEGGDHQPSR